MGLLGFKKGERVFEYHIALVNGEERKVATLAATEWAKAEHWAQCWASQLRRDGAGAWFVREVWAMGRVA